MKDSSNIPQKPEKPSPNECCGSGCVPCIYDYYYERLARWEERCAKQKNESEQGTTK